jgi:hypothetical protein
VKRVIEPLADAAPLQLVASPDNATNCTIRKKRGRKANEARFHARAELLSSATASLKCMAASAAARYIKTSPSKFLENVEEGIYPDYDFEKLGRCYWFEETLLQIIQERTEFEASKRCCTKCGDTKPSWEFPQLKNVDPNVCIECTRVIRNEQHHFEGSNEYREPKFSPNVPERMAAFRFETQLEIDAIRRKAGGAPTDAIRSGLVRRDQVTT